MVKRSFSIWLILGVLAALPVTAMDFHHWRTESSAYRGTSVNQASSNQATNAFDSFTDASQSNFAKFWVNELQENGGQTLNPPFGDSPPTSPLRDVRQQDPEVEWQTWRVAQSKSPVPIRPLYTPNIPQAWNPVVVDIDQTNGTNPDHVLISVGLEPVNPVAAADMREQVINCYFPRIVAGLPGNNPDPAAIAAGDRNTVRPFWVRNNNVFTPGLRVRDLEPVRSSLISANPGVGVVTQPPIFARVPAVYRVGGQTVTETLPVLFLVVGTGEDGDFARVICLALKKPNAVANAQPSPNPRNDPRHFWLPDPVEPGNPNDPSLPPHIEPPNPDYFIPTTGGGGAVLWSYTVRSTVGANPIPVAGCSFANIGDATNSRPCLFLTTADGQIICLNAKGADLEDTASDGDPRIDPNDPTPRWAYQVPNVTPADTGITETPGFHYGMAPAVALVRLTGLFTGQGKTSGTLINAVTKHNVSEWELFVADTYGTFYALEAPGKPVLNGMTMLLDRHDPLVRWTDSEAAVGMPGTIARRDSLGNRERFIVPPVVYQGNTPMENSLGQLRNGSAYIGYDDEVVFASEKGSICALDAIGRLQVLGKDAMTGQYFADDGKPTGTTDLRWKWPRDDTGFTPGIMIGDPVEPAQWPRELPDLNSPVPATRYYGNPINTLTPGPVTKHYFMRSPLAVGLGGDSNPDAANPDLDLGDDHLFVPYIQTLGPKTGLPMGASPRTLLYEYIGSMKPYGFVQLSRPVAELDRVIAKLVGGDQDIPLNRIRVGTVKANGVPSNLVQTTRAPGAGAGAANPNYDPAGPVVYDTLYLTAQTWYDETSDQYYTLPFGTQVEVFYKAPQSPGSQTLQNVQETLVFPSCYRYENPRDPTSQLYRSRASLSVVNTRLEQRRISSPAPPAYLQEDEEPAEVDTTHFFRDQVRQPAIMTSGSLNGLGTLIAPSFYRGRTIAMDHYLRAYKVLLGAMDPRLPAGGTPVPVMGGYIADPGEFFLDGPPWNDMPFLTDVGGSITIVDGWVYITYRNGHVTAWSNLAGAGSGSIYYPPIYIPPSAQANNGSLVEAPVQIRITTDPANPTDTTKYIGGTVGTLDASLLLEWGQQLSIVIDFGDAGNLVARYTGDPNDNVPEIDGQVLENPVIGRIASSNGAVQAPPNQGVRPQVFNGRVIAVVPIFAGQPSPTNPLTPGTPLLWEREPAITTNNFDGEVYYHFSVTQPGVQWRWPDNPMSGISTGAPNPQKVHYWEPERPTVDMITGRNTRFLTTGGTTAGTPKWDWVGALREYAPLVSYNNPIEMFYDPDGAGPLAGLYGPAGAITTPIGGQSTYTDRNEPGRRNGDMYAGNSVDGSRSGSGQAIVPTVGQAIVGGNAARQVLFGEHGKSTPLSTTSYPNLAHLFVADRSFLGPTGARLQLRAATAPLTKMGKGADYGTRGQAALRDLDGAPNRPQGSFEQNLNFWDDGPGQFYSSIPKNRVSVARLGTSLDLSSSPTQVPGRDSNGNLPALSQFQGLGVSIDIPLYTPDDIYSTRWRTSGPNGAPPASAFNPLFPGTLFGENGRPYWDRAEKLSFTSANQIPAAPRIAPGEDNPSPYPDLNPDYDDRVRRIVLYNDANGDGQFTITPNYREAYRTFAVQVMVKPEMKIDVQQQAVDLGAPWHGKKQPGLGAGTNDIREYQRMRQDQSSGTPVVRNVGNFYSQYWRNFTIANTGNVNLAYVKPEVKYTIPAQGTALIGIPGEGNDAWRALSLIHNFTPAALTDPFQIFLRTSFDDQLLPDNSAAYAASRRGVWLQKAQPGSAQPGSVIYVHNTGTPSGLAINRDPSNGGAARETFMAMNVPTGAALGQYGGSIRFYNDRAVTLIESPGAGPGYVYGRPGNTALPDGELDRSTAGEPLEPVCDPPLKLKLKVIENMTHGRGADAAAAAAAPDPERRYQAGAILDTSSQASNNQVRLLLAYTSNRSGLMGGDATRYDLFASLLAFDPNYLLFPYDELAVDRPPWLDFTGGAFGWSQVTAVPLNFSVSKPNLSQDPSTKLGAMAWTERQTIAPGTEVHRINYLPLVPNGNSVPTPGALVQMQPGGQPPSVGTQRTGVKMIPFSFNGYPGQPTWLAFYATGNSVRKQITQTWTSDISNGASWASEMTLATSKSLGSADDPSVGVIDQMQREPAPLPARPNQPPFLLPENTVLPATAYLAYAGHNQRQGRTDVYLNRYRLAALTTTGQRGTADPRSRGQDFSILEWPRVEAAYIDPSNTVVPIGGEVLKANSTRTIYQSAGVDWMIQIDYRPVQVYLARPDLPAGTPGSLTLPVPLINTAQVATLATNDEAIFSLTPALTAQPQLQSQRIVIDRAAGIVRLPMDARTLARLAIPAQPFSTTTPDPVILADYVPGGQRITSGDASGSSPVIVPAIAQPGQPPIMDASWYRQQVTTNAWNNGIPIAGRADRLYIFWRRAAGRVSGGPSCFYKVLRPGVKLRLGTIAAIDPANFQVSTPTLPEEVNPANGQIFFPATYEGQQVIVRYRSTQTGQLITEQHLVRWVEESGEMPVPMETSVNEGSLEAFPSFEQVPMAAVNGNLTTSPVTKLEKLWLFWSSTRGSGGDLFWATIAPRIGPEANVGGSVTRTMALSLRSRNVTTPQALQFLQQAAMIERRRPALLPNVTRRGPWVPAQPRRITPTRAAR